MVAGNFQYPVGATSTVFIFSPCGVISEDLEEYLYLSSALGAVGSFLPC